MSAAHTPGPWAVGNCPQTASVMVNGKFERMGRASSAAVAARIVACVNACEGMDDPAKRIAAMAHAYQAADGRLEIAERELSLLRAERAELLAALKEASDCLAETYAKYQTKIGPWASQCQRVNGVARAAIAKAEAAS